MKFQRRGNQIVTNVKFFVLRIGLFSVEWCNRKYDNMIKITCNSNFFWKRGGDLKNFVYLWPVIFQSQHFNCSTLTRTGTSKEIIRANLISVGVCALSADFTHRILEVVPDLSEIWQVCAYVFV